MYKGSCLCGKVKYEIADAPISASSCYCKMCQKQHGAAFATYVSIFRTDLVYLSDLAELSSFRSSEGVTRKFCGTCGSNIEWSGNKHPEKTSIALATFDTKYNPEHIFNIHFEDRASWYDIS